MRYIPAAEESAPAAAPAAAAPAAPAPAAVDVKDLKLTPRAKTYVKNEGIDELSRKNVRNISGYNELINKENKTRNIEDKIKN